MLRFLKKFGWAALLVAALPWVSGFTPIGPSAGYPGLPANWPDAWQAPIIGYNPLPAGSFSSTADLLQTGPKNLGEEYRRNTPVMYYTCDANFLDYFGSNGVYAVDQAFAILNSLTNVSRYSADLSEVPLEVEGINYLAEALTLSDLKSTVLGEMVEQLGLAEPVRYIWNIHNREIPPGGVCPGGLFYAVIQRNFDPVPSPLNQLQASSYVNGILYSYAIEEVCQSPVNPLAEAVEFPVDPTAPFLTAAADVGHNLFPGRFLTGLTRDDVGGFRYLYGTNNMNVESSGPGTFAFVTNNTSQLFFGTNFQLFAAQALTNDPVALAALFPNLAITATTNTFTNIWVTNVTAYFTNSPFDPVGTPPHVAFATNRTLTVQTLFIHTFANLFRVQPVPGGFSATPLTQIPSGTDRAIVTTITNIVVVTNPPFSPAGTLVVQTNITGKTYMTNGNFGEVIILPTNFCDVAVVAVQSTNVITTTNTITTLTNTTTLTNVSGAVLSFTSSRVDYFTNHAFVVLPITCQTNTIALRQGIEKMTFIRRDFDSLLSRFFQPITNQYILIAVTNNAPLRQRISRVVSAPDFVFSAADLTAGPSASPFRVSAFTHNINFNFSNEYPGLAGPGTIESSSQITFNKVGPLYINPLFFATVPFTEQTAGLVLAWGSFDGTTNAPIVYPNGTSINNLQTQILVQVTPLYPAEGRVGSFYSQPLQALSSTSTFVAPFTWALAPGSPALPPDLTIDSTGVISGIPTMAGFYDFVIEITDSQGATLDRSMAIKINP